MNHRESAALDNHITGHGDQYEARCPACGDVIDFCQGHGDIGDPAGAAILASHDEGYHGSCHPFGCEERTR